MGRCRLTQYSYSRVDLWTKCPYHYRLRYIEKLHEIPRLDADSPLILGHALHKGIESGEQAMEKDYYDSYPVITNEQVNEMTKLQLLLPKVNAQLSAFKGCKFQHEYPIYTSDFIGFADLIITAPDGTSTVIDFKYSNHIENYMESGQLHLYKYYLDQLGFNVTHLAYMFIPKTGIRQKNTEDLFHFRKRIESTLAKEDVKLVPIEYDDINVIYFQNRVKQIEHAAKEVASGTSISMEYPRNVSGKCFACMPRFAPEYLEMLQTEEGDKVMPIPKNKRREKKTDLAPDVWLYADSYVGKTTFWDSFPDVLMLNTDGNTDNITSPVDTIKDVVTKEGRMEKRTYAWEQFMGDVTDLEAGNPEGYKTVVLDLVEDLYDACRLYVLKQHGWEHESDGGYGKGWSMVANEFHNAIKRLKVVGLQVVYISKEDRREVTLKGGRTRTTFAPNIAARTANFLTGTVDITMRAYVNEDGSHMLQLIKQPNVFGGGRFEFKQDEIPLERDEFLAALGDAQPKTGGRTKNKPEMVEPEEGEEKPKRKRRTKKTPDPEPEPETDTKETPEAPVEESKPKRRSRKTRKTEDDEDQVTPPGEGDDEETAAEETEKPKHHRRERKPRETEEDAPEEPKEEAPKRRPRRRRHRTESED